MDLTIILGSIGILFWVGSQRSRSTIGNPSPSRWIGYSGIVIFLLLFLLEISMSAFVLDDVGLDSPHFLASPLPEWLHWLLTRSGIALLIVGILLSVIARQNVDKAFEASTNRAIEAADQALQSESRFRSLFETTSDSVYCYNFDPPMRISLPIEAQIRRSHDAILTECNHVFARVLEKVEPSEVIGTTMAFLDSTKDEEAHTRFIEAFIESGYRISNYELIYKSLEGEDRAVSLSLTGIVKDGFLHRFWGVENNILDVRRTRVALYRRRMFQEMQAHVSSKLVMTRFKDGKQAIENSLEQVCHFVGGNRMRLMWLDWEEATASIVYSYQGGSGRDPPTTVNLSDFPQLTKNLINNELLHLPDVTDESVCDRPDALQLAALGIKSFLFLPVAVGGEVVAAVTLGDDEQLRHWSEQDMSDLRVIAELIGSFVLRMRQRKALDEAMDGLQNATERLEAENVYLRSEIKLDHDFGEIIGESDTLRRSLKMVEQVADTMTPVLVLGETGTGKELIARALHDHSARSARPLVKVNCAALPANLIESELFGYEKGAFTSAESSKRGRFDLADGSTLFLDEIGEIPIELQSKLLRVLQEGEFERLGGNKTIKVNVRIIAATNRDLSEAVDMGEFRSDLYYRINTFPIELPPLRDRGTDIRLLAEHFARQHAQRLGREITAISASMMRDLEQYDWPGNVRELEGVIQRSLISSPGVVLELGQALSVAGTADTGANVAPDLRSVERDHIVAVLNECKWKISGNRGAATRLEVPPSTLRSKMKKLGIERPV